eukprot:7141477-Prymnesium_polylepis.1
MIVDQLAAEEVQQFHARCERLRATPVRDRVRERLRGGVHHESPILRPVHLLVPHATIWWRPVDKRSHP